MKPSTILCLIPLEADQTLSRHQLEIIEAGRKIQQESGAKLCIGAWGSKAPQNTFAPADRHLMIVDASLSQARYASDSVAAESLIRASGADLVLAAASSRIQRFLPGVAQRLGAEVDTHVTGLEMEDAGLVATRWYYRQRMFAKLARQSALWLISIDSGCFATATGEGNGAWESVSLPACTCRSQVTGLLSSAGGTQTIRPEAELLLVAGAGWTKKQADGSLQFKRAEQNILGFIEKAKASLGSSKSMVDLSAEGQEVLPFLTHLHQVGQTGSTPRHRKGLATCCHGEEPHAVGWRFIQERRAINLDANCGWAHGKADVLYVADAFEVMEKVNALLES
jgi:electron transfer flavoprotein alpha subunit